ncbi:hypothetical protein GmHk_10G028129 [Glycine max]|nr:hypothetical protein GmHk_10G028129 [Glycine max]
MAAEFLEETIGLAVQQQGADSWVWKQDSSEIYSTRTAYKFLLGEIRGESEDGSFSLLWKLKIPPKAKVFTWRLIKDRLPTKMNLRGRQVEIVDPLCLFCNNLDEDAAHLFFNCSKVLPLWWQTLSWVKSVGAFPKELKDHFMHHRSNATRTKDMRWSCWWIALRRTIWHHRNKLVFDNQAFNASKLMDDALFLLWSWLKVMEKDFDTHFNQWSSNLSDGGAVGSKEEGFAEIWKLRIPKKYAVFVWRLFKDRLPTKKNL